MNPTSQKIFKVICQDEPYFRKKIQSNLSRLNPTFQKNFKVICQDAPYFPEKFQSNSSR